MLGHILRVGFGFVLACLAAGLTLVLFVYTPLELAGLTANVAASRLGEAGILALAAATHASVFSAPFALAGATFGEWRSFRNPAYYALLGVAIAAAGFFVQYHGEAAGDLSILNTYALSAFALTGLIGGLVYWLGAGRHAGGRPRQQPVTASADAAPPDTPAAAAEAPKT
ncbi:MAG TPA: hypothetical protein VN523_12225 [Hyphomicrobiaceae bacterium]|jgi:hypothetical protein|nr:hypothetical protein [Hyphomicrobiaceae bacterium]